MIISDLLLPEAVIPALKAQSKKQLLQELAARACTLTGIAERKIFETLNERERLGSTGVGQGIAIPHGRLADVGKIVGIFARLDRLFCGCGACHVAGVAKPDENGADDGRQPRAGARPARGAGRIAR